MFLMIFGTNKFCLLITDMIVHQNLWLLDTALVLSLVSLIGLVLDGRDLVRDLTLRDLDLTQECTIGLQVLDQVLTLDLILGPGVEIAHDIDLVHFLTTGRNVIILIIDLILNSLKNRDIILDRIDINLDVIRGVSPLHLPLLALIQIIGRSLTGTKEAVCYTSCCSGPGFGQWFSFRGWSSSCWATDNEGESSIIPTTMQAHYTGQVHSIRHD